MDNHACVLPDFTAIQRGGRGGYRSRKRRRFCKGHTLRFADRNLCRDLRIVRESPDEVDQRVHLVSDLPAGFTRGDGRNNARQFAAP